MILKITDLQNYTQFINTQPLNKNVKININIIDDQQEKVFHSKYAYGCW